MSARPRLLVLPSLTSYVYPDSRIRLTEKFVDGMQAYVDRWPGPVAVILEPDCQAESGNLDDRALRPTDLPFAIHVMYFSSPELNPLLARSSVVMGGADHRLNHLPAMCRKIGTAYVFVTEYSLRTRCQIIDSEAANPIVRARRKLWAYRQELHNRRSATLAAALQCNGTPTFDAYSALNSDPLLYFDSRIDDSMFPDAPMIRSRLDALRRGSPIHLAFSGRLSPMKGADDLPRVADELRRRGVPFRLSIFGDGPLRARIRQDIDRLGLSADIQLHGVLDFKSRLVPLVRDHVDLFVCPHKQGDPSCTYIETMACGVPIVGYGNEALDGILRHSGAGWCVPLNRPDLLAERIHHLYVNPEMVAAAADEALGFARGRTFQKEFDRRVEQMRRHAGIG